VSKHEDLSLKCRPQSKQPSDGARDQPAEPQSSLVETIINRFARYRQPALRLR
jgi:hypothetical protein